jgi:hypothetical protein
MKNDQENATWHKKAITLRKSMGHQSSTEKERVFFPQGSHGTKE